MACVYHLSQVRNMFQYPLSKRIKTTTCKTPSETLFSSCNCVYHQTLSWVQVERKALSLRRLHCTVWLMEQRSCRARLLRRSVGDIKRVSKRLCVYHLYRNVFQIALFLAFQKGVSNPLIKTALRLSSAKITPDSCLETLILCQKCDDKHTHTVWSNYHYNDHTL